MRSLRTTAQGRSRSTSRTTRRTSDARPHERRAVGQFRSRRSRVFGIRGIRGGDRAGRGHPSALVPWQVTQSVRDRAWSRVRSRRRGYRLTDRAGVVHGGAIRDSRAPARRARHLTHVPKRDGRPQSWFARLGIPAASRMRRDLQAGAGRPRARDLGHGSTVLRAPFGPRHSSCSAAFPAGGTPRVSVPNSSFWRLRSRC